VSARASSAVPSGTDATPDAVHRGWWPVVASRTDHARRRAIALLTGVLALESADLATLGAIAGPLERRMHIGHAGIGLLASAGLLVAAAASVPAGMLTDRMRRVPILAGAVALWSAAMVASGAAGSLGALLAARLLLGAVTAVAGPTVASLTGDLIAREQRARVYGVMLSGELIGSGVGFLVSGEIAAMLGWRWAFWVLAPPALALAWALRRGLPEPARYGGGARSTDGGRASRDDAARRAVRASDVEPNPATILHRDPARLSLPAAVRYVLRIRTNRLLILASAIGYFFFSGQRTFTVVFIRGNYGVTQAAATSLVGVMGIGALAGVVLGGRIADRLLAGEHLAARVVVAAVCYVVAAILFVPSLLTASVAVALAPALAGAAALSAPNAPLDAARLDIMPAGLWGRAESIRGVLRAVAVAAAPLLFGWTADRLGGGADGIRWTFLIMLVPLASSGLVLLRARMTYPGDMATAVASDAAVGARSTVTTARGRRRATGRSRA
jgi:predicted MFS family arabinose efflux permease